MPARRPSFRDDIEYEDDHPRRFAGEDDDGAWKAVRSRRQEAVAQEIEKRRESGEALRPEVPAHGRNLSGTFWGQAWNRNLMAYSDYDSRMPRGRTCFRSGGVMDLKIDRGTVTAVVAGTRIYEVRISVAPLEEERWAALKKRCQGEIGGLVELLSGQLSDRVMREVTELDRGLFPSPQEMKLSCSCPDYAGLCKHLAATLYAVGSRLDDQPALLFTLRGVDPSEMVVSGAPEAIAHLTAPAESEAARVQALEGVDLSRLFGIGGES